MLRSMWCHIIVSLSRGMRKILTREKKLKQKLKKKYKKNKNTMN